MLQPAGGKPGASCPMLVKHFERQGNQWQVKQRLREKITTQKLNLAEEWPGLPTVDLVLMRNVLIYFDRETKMNVLERVRKQLRPEGFLFLGGAETTLNLDGHFAREKHEKTTYYRLAS